MAWALIRITTTFPLLSGIPSNDLMDKFKITKKKKKTHTHTKNKGFSSQSCNRKKEAKTTVGRKLHSSRPV